MSNIVIVGASGLGREVYHWLSDLGEKVNTKGFLDPNKNALLNSKIDLPILGTEVSYTPESNDEFVIAITDHKIKQKVISILKNKNAKFRSVIHPTAIISEYAKLGAGVIIYPFASISCDATIGSFTVVNLGAVIAHDVTVGEHSFIGTYTNLGGWSTIGSKCYIGSGAVITQRSTVENSSKVSSNVCVFGKVKTGEIVMPLRNKKVKGGMLTG